MKNLVLSRKGFDATGGRASPIFENGDIFSVPIPKKSRRLDIDLRFSHLSEKKFWI